MSRPLGRGWHPAPDTRAMDAIQARLAAIAANPVCEFCGHGRNDHAFYPSGEAAAFCDADYKPDDRTLLDHNCDCEGFAPILCEHTADGADPTPTNPACGLPATVRHPGSRVDFEHDEWYCAEHADPAWPVWLATEEN